MKKVLLSVIALACCSTAFSQQLDYLTVRTADGAEMSLPVEGLKMTFEGKQLHAVAQGKSASFDLADLSLMFFAAEPTAIETVKVGADEVRIVNGKLVVNAPEGAAVQVYTMDGRQVNDCGLLHGVYLVKVNGRTYKVMAK